MKHIIRTTLFLLCGGLMLHSCSDENENALSEANGKLVPLVIAGQLPAGILTPGGDGSTTDARGTTRTSSPSSMAAANQVVIEVEYPAMTTDKGRAIGLYTLIPGAKGEDGVQPYSLAPYAGNPATEVTRNENTLRVPAAGKFTLRIHGMAGEAYPISHVATDVSLDASGKLELGKLSMASAHIAVKVEGAYGEGILSSGCFGITFQTLHAPQMEETNNIYLWQEQPKGSHTDGTGLGNYWLLTPAEEQATGVTSGEEEGAVPSYISITTPSSVKAKSMFLSLKGVDKNAAGETLKHAYVGKTFRVATDKELTYEASKSYTYTVRLTETTAIITDVQIADWIPLEDKNIGNQPGIYTAQDFNDFAAAWNLDGKDGIGLKKYQKWMNYADTVKLMNNIDLGSSFTAIGTDAKPFTALFQGDGYTITADGGALFGYNDGRIEAIIRAGAIQREGGIATKNTRTIVACINKAPVTRGAAGIALNNTGGLYGCSSIGRLGNDVTGLTTDGAAGIALQGNGNVKGCYYLSVADDGKERGVRSTTIQILNDAVPALNNGVYRTYDNGKWKYAASTSPTQAAPKLVRGNASFNPGIYTAQDFVNFAKAWNIYGATELAYNSQYSDWYNWSGDKVTLYVDIDLADATPFTAIGTADKPFTGRVADGNTYPITFDGKSHSIAYKGGSLFGIVEEIGTITGLKRAGTIIGSKQAGIVTTNSGTITSCTNAAAVLNEQSAGIAHTNNSTVMLCTNNAPVSGIASAGIVQTNTQKVITCVNNGEVTGKNAAGIAVSGTGNSNYVVACVNTAAIKGEQASGIMTTCPEAGTNTKKRIIACLSTRTVSGASAIAIAPNIGTDGTDACYYISIQAQQTFGKALPNLLQMNSAAIMKALNAGIANWNKDNNDACDYHYLSGSPADTAVPTFGDGAPTAPID